MFVYCKAKYDLSKYVYISVTEYVCILEKYIIILLPWHEISSYVYMTTNKCYAMIFYGYFMAVKGTKVRTNLIDKYNNNNNSTLNWGFEK